MNVECSTMLYVCVETDRGVTASCVIVRGGQRWLRRTRRFVTLVGQQNVGLAKLTVLSSDEASRVGR